MSAALSGNAQTVLVQPLSVSLIAYDQASETSVLAIRVTTKDFIRFLTGTTVPSAQLWLVTPTDGPGPTTLDNRNAFLRITSGRAVFAEVPSPDSFNIFQDFAAATIRGSSISVHGTDRFSIDFGGFHAELQGATTWSASHRLVSGVDTSASGSFRSTVNGNGTIDGVTPGNVPMSGTISGGSPKPGT
jgi:hypothetical protein